MGMSSQWATSVSLACGHTSSIFNYASAIFVKILLRSQLRCICWTTSKVAGALPRSRGQGVHLKEAWCCPVSDGIYVGIWLHALLKCAVQKAASFVEGQNSEEPGLV